MSQTCDRQRLEAVAVAGNAGDRDVDGQSSAHDRPAVAEHSPAQLVQGEGQDTLWSDPSRLTNTGDTEMPSKGQHAF